MPQGFYQDPTNYAFTGSQQGVLPSTLDQINPGYYNQISAFIAANGGRLASVSGIRLYDALRVDAGIQPTRTFNFFQNGLNAQQSLFVTTATTYVKQNIDVSYWIDNGKLSQGYEALVWSMQVLVQLCGSLDESIQTAGNAVGLTLDPGIISGEAATDAVKAGNLMRAILEGYYFEFFMNNTSLILWGRSVVRRMREFFLIDSNAAMPTRANLCFA